MKDGERLKTRGDNSLLVDQNIDKKLWFKLSEHDCNGSHYIMGNPHTFKGRMMGWCTEKKKSFYFSLGEISEMSEETKYWIKGFLVGSEPNPPIGEDGRVEYGSVGYEHWLHSTILFKETGYWNDEERKCLKCNKILLKSMVGEYCHEC